VSNVPLKSFGQRFALTQTINKLANVASEVGELEQGRQKGILKASTSGDRMMFDRKGIDPVEQRRRQAGAGDEQPAALQDRSGGIWRRVLLGAVPGRDHPDQRVPGMDRPAWWLKQSELPGVFNWAVEGLKRLRNQRRFTEPAVCKQEAGAYREDVNPARAFLTEHCQEQAGTQTLSDLLYGGYVLWCRSNGYRPLARTTSAGR